MTTIAPLTQRVAWQALQAHYPQVQPLQLRQLFADDPTCGERLTTEAIGIYFDYSKHRITDETLTLLHRTYTFPDITGQRCLFPASRRGVGSFLSTGV